MTAIRSSRLRWALIPLVALAVLATLALVRGERPADQRVQLPFDFRQSAGTSTDTLISSLQERIRENPKRLRLAHQIWPMPISRKCARRATRPSTPRRKTCSIRPASWKISLQSCSPHRGALALARHDFAAALQHGTRALALDPENARYYGIVGDAQIELGMYEEAIDSYQEMVDRKPDFASFSRVAYARELYGDPEGAIEAMEFALQAGSGTPENVAWAHVQLGNLWFTSGKLQEAQKAYERVDQNRGRLRAGTHRPGEDRSGKGGSRTGCHPLPAGIQPHAPP